MSYAEVGGIVTMFEIKNLKKFKYGKPLFPNFSLHIQAGEVVALYCESEIRSSLMNILTSSTTEAKSSITCNHICHHKQFQEFMKQTCFYSYTDGLYERLTVLDHIRFYKRLYGSSDSIDYILDQTMLHNVSKQKVGQLTYSEKRRVHFSRIFLQDVPLYILEEPDIHIDMETKQIYTQLIHTLAQANKHVLILTSNLEHAIFATNRVYELNQQGCKKVHIQTEEQIEASKNEEHPFQFDKIPTKVEDKILLFDPYNIDYIESVEGQAFLYVNGEKFPTTFTLQQLEKRLQPFGFFRCHRSYIVNLQKVKEVITWTRNSFNLILEDQHETSIPLSKSKMSELKGMIGLN